MTVEEAAEAARTLKPAIFYPYHYRGAEVSKLKELLADVPEIEVRIADIY